MRKFRKAFCVLLMLAMVATMLTACNRAYTFADYKSGHPLIFLAQDGVSGSAVITPISDTRAVAILNNVPFTMNKVTKYYDGYCDVRLLNGHLLFKPTGVTYYYCAEMCKDEYGNIVSATTSGVKFSLVYESVVNDPTQY